MKKISLLFLLSAFALNCIAQSVKLTSSFNNRSATATSTVSHRFIPYDGKVFLALAASTDVNVENGYQYKGKIYKTTQVSGLSPLLNVLKASYPKVTLKVYYKSVFREEITTTIDGFSLGVLGDGVYLKNVSKTELADVAGWRMEGVSLNSYTQENLNKWFEVDEFLAKYETGIREKKEFDLLLTEGNSLFAKKDFLPAEAKYKEALRYKQNEVFINQQLVAIKKAIEGADKKRQYESFIAMANTSKVEKDYTNALTYYKGALVTGYNDSFAKQQADLVTIEINRLKDEQEQAIKKANADLALEKKKIDEQTVDANKVRLQKEAEQKILEKVTAENEERELARLAEIDRVKVEAEREEQLLKEKKDRELKEKKKEEERKERKKAKRKALDDRIEAIEEIMEFNPEKLKQSLAEARAVKEKSESIEPYKALAIKSEWYDSNSYMEEFRDELNEPKRRKANEDYFQLLLAKTDVVNNAINLYLKALSYAENGSSTHKHIINQINLLESESEILDTSVEFNAEHEQLRRTYQESNRVMLKIQKMDFNAQRTANAFQTINYINALNRGDGTANVEASIQQFNLNNRLNEAQEANKANKLIAGAATGLAMGALLDDSKQALKYGNNSMGFNVRISGGYMSIPITVNTAVPGYQPSSTIKSIDPVHVLPELDFWALRNTFVDLGITAGGLFGVDPITGASNNLFSYYGKVKVNAGAKRIKLAVEGALGERIGNYKVDNDVAAVDAGYELTPDGARGAITEGKFKYSFTKVGGGLHLDISDEQNEKYIRALIFAEQISFLKNSFTKNPIYSYALEFSLGTGITISGEYAKNYVSGGTAQYEMEKKNKALWAVRFGKIFTLVKTK